ncbi:MAG: HD domain-containing phosphohydrolase [Candidatus Omnitrophota bacterium]
MEFDRIELFLKNLMSSWQAARVYGTEHKLFLEALQKAYGSLAVILSDRDELVVGILDRELASGEDIFFELSKRAVQAIDYLKKINVERIAFRRGVSREELVKFIVFLITPVENMQLLPQEYLSAAGVNGITVAKIKSPTKSSPEQQSDEKIEFMHYKGCLDRLSHSLDALINSDRVDHVNLKFIANDIMENLSGKYQIFSKLRQTKSYDTATFMHLLNVSILSIYLSHKLGFSRNDCLDIGIAGLFHDIGKLYIAKKILQKKDKLDKEEFDKIKSHTVLGAEILLRHVDTLTVLPVVVAFEHHLRYDLKGYPKLFFPRKLRIASLIIMICDVYDALLQRRSYKRDYPPEKVYEAMVSDKGRRFDPKLLDKFFKTLGVFPAGTIVRLNDGKVAIVRDQNEDDIFSPVVEVVGGVKGELIDLKSRKDIKVEQSLNPLSEGKDYFDLI